MIGLRQKLSLGFGGLLVIILIIGGQSIIQFQELGQSIDVILRENYRSVVACQEMKEALERMDSGILFVLLGYDEEGRKLIFTNEERFEKALKVELGNITVPGEGQKAAALKDLFARYREALDGILTKPPSGEQSRNRYFRELLPLFSAVEGNGGRHPADEPGQHARRQRKGPAAGDVCPAADVPVPGVRYSDRGGFYLLYREVDPPAHRPPDPFRRRDPGGNLDLVVQTDSRMRSAGYRRRSTT